jgi:hypothetical protein
MKIRHDVLVRDPVPETSAAHRLPRGPHVVQFYEDDSFLAERVAEVIADAVAAGGSGLVIATGEHRASIDQALERKGVHAPWAEEAGPYRSLDAAEMLSRLMVADRLDRDRFEQVVGGAIATLHASRPSGRVHVFGEMVALLWAEGHAALALELEELWIGLARSHSFSLVCAYPVRGFADNDDGNRAIRAIASLHDEVMPEQSESLVEAAVRSNGMRRRLNGSDGEKAR